MLSEAERTEIESQIEHARTRSSGLIEALRVVQKHRGWISDEAVGEIAEFLGMTSAEVDSVATFYNRIFRKPVGKHVIHVCDSISCWVMGSESVKQLLARNLTVSDGGTSSDGMFTLLPVDCLGACHKAPVMLIDGELYEELSDERIENILNEIRAKE